MKQKLITILLALVALLGGGAYVATNTQLGSSGVADAYLATTTPQVADTANLCVRPTGQTLSSTGVLGTVNILKANTSAFTIYDATTTNSNLRLGNAATSTLILAEFPGTPTPGSYPFNVQTKYGILIDYATAATVSTSTITFLCTL